MSLWYKIPPDNCNPMRKIKHTTVSNIKDGWNTYNDDWCSSCYSAYIQVCRRVYKEFGLNKTRDYHFKEDDLKNAAIKLVITTKDEDYKSWLKKNEKKIESIIECINMRVYQHHNCHNNTKETNGFNVSNKGHMRFLLTACSSLLKLFILYEFKLKQYNNEHKNKKRNILTDLNKECSYFCFGALTTNDVDMLLDEMGLNKEDIFKIDVNHNKINMTDDKANKLLKSREINKIFKLKSPYKRKLSKRDRIK